MDLFEQFEASIGESFHLPVLAGSTAGLPIKTQEDRQEEWLKQRWGVFTASEVHKLMAYTDKDELPKGAISYVRKKTSEALTEFSPEPIITAAMQWGIDKEPEALDAFMQATGHIVSKCKDAQEFISAGHYGGTPDGIIAAERSGIEIKCPNSDTHLAYLAVRTAADLKAVAPEYYWQIVCLMLLTKAKRHWYFVSYDPRYLRPDLRLHIAKIKPDSGDFGKLTRRLQLAHELKQSMLLGLKRKRTRSRKSN